MSELTYGRELIYANDIDYYDLKLPKQYYGANAVSYTHLDVYKRQT